MKRAIQDDPYEGGVSSPDHSVCGGSGAAARWLEARPSPSPYLYFFRATNVSSDASGGHANLTGV